MKKGLSLIFAVVTVVSIAMAPLSSSAAADNLNGTANPDHITLTWSQDPKTTQTITWRTNTDIANGKVQYILASDAANFPDKATVSEETAQKLTTDAGDINIHSVTLTGLEAGKKYLYRVGDGTNWSEQHFFTTEDDNAQGFKFLIFGDSQSGQATNPEYGPWKTTVQNAFKANQDAKFFVNVGDLVENGQTYIHWNNWFDATKGVIDAIPDMSVQGNHETYVPTSSDSIKPKFWTAQFKLPQNGPDGLKNQTYSYDYGNAHIVVLDSQEDEEKNINGSILEAQKQWLDNDLKSSDKTWKLVFFHKTPYYNKANRTNEAVKAAFQPIFDKYHVDVVFNGHDHGISRTYPINNDKFVDSTSEGTVYYVTGRSGNKYYTDLSQKVWDAFFYDPQDQPNYIVAQINGDKLNLKATKQDGTLIDDYTIDKTAGTDSPKSAIPPKYNDTRLVIFGNMLQQPFLTTTPKKIGEKWYVPARAFVQYNNGSVVWNDNGKLTLTSGKKAEVTVGSTDATLNGSALTLPDKVVLDQNNTLISADDISAIFGFTYKYDDTTNMLSFTK